MSRSSTGKSDATPGPRSIGGVVARLLARTGYDREQGSNLIADAWLRAAPEGLREHSRAGVVRRGVLEVFVTHSALVQEMGFHKRDLLDRLGTLLPREAITDIRCRVMADVGGAGGP